MNTEHTELVKALLEKHAEKLRRKIKNDEDSIQAISTGKAKSSKKYKKIVSVLKEEIRKDRRGLVL